MHLGILNQLSILIFFALAAFLAMACSDSVVEEGRFSNDEKRAELRRLVNESERAIEADPVVVEGTVLEPTIADTPLDSDDILARLDSALASDDDEAIGDYLLDLEDQGGEIAVRGMGIAIDHALDEEIKLDAIAALAMMENEDVRAPLLRALSDQSEDVQIAALEVIADSEMFDLLSVLRLRKERENNEATLEALDETIEESSTSKIWIELSNPSSGFAARSCSISLSAYCWT